MRLFLVMFLSVCLSSYAFISSDVPICLFDVPMRVLLVMFLCVYC